MSEPGSFVTRLQTTKEEAIKKIARIVREEGWDYEDFRYATVELGRSSRLSQLRNQRSFLGSFRKKTLRNSIERLKRLITFSTNLC